MTTLWLSWLERWLATLGVLSVQVRIPVYVFGSPPATPTGKVAVQPMTKMIRMVQSMAKISSKWWYFRLSYSAQHVKMIYIWNKKKWHTQHPHNTSSLKRKCHVEMFATGCIDIWQLPVPVTKLLSPWRYFFLMTTSYATGDKDFVNMAKLETVQDAVWSMSASEHGRRNYHCKISWSLEIARLVA